MPITTQVFTLGDTGIRIVEKDNMPQEVHLKNMTKSSNEYVWVSGDSSVSATAGLELEPQEHVVLNLRPGDELWAMSTPDGLEVGVMAIRKND